MAARTRQEGARVERLPSASDQHPRPDFALLRASFRLPRDYGIRLPDSAAFIAGSFQAFVGDLRPKLFQRPGRRLMRVPFGVISSPGHLQAPWLLISVCALSSHRCRASNVPPRAGAARRAMRQGTDIRDGAHRVRHQQHSGGRLDRDGNVSIDPFDTGLYSLHVLGREIHKGATLPPTSAKCKRPIIREEAKSHHLSQGRRRGPSHTWCSRCRASSNRQSVAVLASAKVIRQRVNFGDGCAWGQTCS
jgi:hypothetical protein